MADKRISQLIERTDIANNDVLPIVASGATTTNKVTISTIQEWMQDNLDVGVTSVGITIGSTGTDINVTGSPITTSGNITINIPTASATNRGLLSSSDWTSFNNKLSSVGLTMPSAFTVSNSPLTANGTIAVTGAGTVAQYIRGDGSLADFPEAGGGGASVSYYLNGSVSQGTIGGIAYREMNKTPILGAGTNFTIAADGYIASFITDAGDPNLLLIPGGNWNLETYFAASSGGGTPSFYVELYKVDSGGTATLIASNSANPELIAFGTTTTAYFSSLAVPPTVLNLTDRLALRYYVNHSGRTITMHTEDANLCQVITTFTTGLTALNGLTAQVQNFATGTSGTDFNISSTSATHTFNLPDASASNRGAVTTGTQTIAGNKTLTRNIDVNGVMVGRGASSGDLFAGIAGNTSVGSSALISITTGFPNTALGSEALRNITTGANNIAIGSEAGKIDSGSSAANATSSSSIYIGNSTKPQTNGNTNEIVIGHAASGNGSNSVTIGNSSTTFNKFFGATQSDTFRLPSDGGGNQVTIIENIGTIHEGTASINKIGFNNSNNIYFGKGLSNGGVISWNNAAVRYYTLPDADGTIALTSQIPANPVGGTGAAGRVAYWNGTGTITSDSLFQWNDFSKRLGIGRTPTVSLDVEGAGFFSTSVTSQQNNITADGAGVVLQGYVDNALRIAVRGSGYNSGARGGLLASTGDFSGALNGTTATFLSGSSSTIGLIVGGAGGSGATRQGQIRFGDAGTVYKIQGGEDYSAMNFMIGSGTPLSLASTGAATFSSSVTATQLNLKDSSTDNPSSLALFEGAQTGRGLQIGLTTDSLGANGAAVIYNARVGGGYGGHIFQNGGSTKMIINASGNVGIGTALPQYKFEVSDGSRTGVFNPNSVFDGFFIGIKESKPLVLGTGDTERMRITSGGNVLVGTSTANVNLNGIQVNNTSGTNFISVNTTTSGIAMRFYTGTSVQAGYIAVDGSTTSYVTSSDYRLKENVKPVENALSTLEKLKPYTFNFISEPEKEVVGFLAHEVQEVIPQAIHGEKDAVTIEQVEVFPAELDEEGNIITEAVIEKQEVPVYQGIDHSKLVPLLVAAIQEQQEQIKSLTEQVEALKSQING